MTVISTGISLYPYNIRNMTTTTQRISSGSRSDCTDIQCNFTEAIRLHPAEKSGGLI